MAEDEVLRSAPAEQHPHLVLQLLAGHEIPVLGRALDGVPERADAARDDGDLVDRVAAGKGGGDERVPHLVVRHDLALPRIEEPVLLLQPGDDPLDGQVEVVHGDLVGAAAGRDQRRFVHQICEVCAREPRRERGDVLELHVHGEDHAAGVDLEDLLASDAVGSIDQHLPVEAAGSQQRRIENLGPVGGGDQHDAGGRVEPVHLDQELVQRLLLLVVTAEPRHASGAAERVQFVDEDDAGRLGAGLLEQVPHAGRAHADEHLHELRPGDGEERHPRLARHGLGQQRFSASGRAHQQHAARNLRAQRLELLRVLEELDDLLQLLLRLIHAGDVLKGHLRPVLGVQTGAALPERHGLIAATLGLAQHQQPQADEQEERQHGR